MLWFPSHNGRQVVLKDTIGCILPHRGPMCLLDQVAIDDMKYTGYFKPTINAPYFQGHFPGNPIVPVTTLEEVAAQFGLFVSADQVYPGRSVKVLAKEISGKMRSDRPVRPGDIVEITLTGDYTKRVVGQNMFIKGETILAINGKTIATALVSGLMIPTPW